MHSLPRAGESWAEDFRADAIQEAAGFGAERAGFYRDQDRGCQPGFFIRVSFPPSIPSISFHLFLLFLCPAVVELTLRNPFNNRTLNPSNRTMINYKSNLHCHLVCSLFWLPVHSHQKLVESRKL